MLCKLHLSERSIKDVILYIYICPKRSTFLLCYRVVLVQDMLGAVTNKLKVSVSEGIKFISCYCTVHCKSDGSLGQPSSQLRFMDAGWFHLRLPSQYVALGTTKHCGKVEGARWVRQGLLLVSARYYLSNFCLHHYSTARALESMKEHINNP